MICQFFYIQFFSQYILLPLISMVDSLTDQAVVNSMLVGSQWVDLYFLILLALFVVVYRKMGILSLDRKMLLFLLLIYISAIPFSCR